MAKRKQKFFFATEIALSAIAVLILSCGVKRHVGLTAFNQRLDTIFNTTGSIEIQRIKKNDTIMMIVRDYIKNNPRYNTFALMEMPVTRLQGNGMGGIFIGPGYKELFNEEFSYFYRASDTLTIDNSRVYIIPYKNEHSAIPDGWANTNPKDSVPIGHDSTKVSFCFKENFLWRALYIYRRNGEYRTIDRLDTVMFPKRVEPSIKFSRPVIAPDSIGV